MVNRCVAAGCSNTPSDRVSLHKFPTDPKLREKWVKQVRRTCVQWTATKSSVLCSEHFTEDSFEVDSAITAMFGISKRRRLKPDAVPTIFLRQSSVGSASQDQQTRKRVADTVATSSSKCVRGATEKRERTRVSSSYNHAFAVPAVFSFGSNPRLSMNCLIIKILIDCC